MNSDHLIREKFNKMVTENPHLLNLIPMSGIKSALVCHFVKRGLNDSQIENKKIGRKRSYINKTRHTYCGCISE